MKKIFTLPAGTVCQRNGISFVLATATLIECLPEDWPQIRDALFPNKAQVDEHYAKLARQIAGLQP